MLDDGFDDCHERGGHDWMSLMFMYVALMKLRGGGRQ